MRVLLAFPAFTEAFKRHFPDLEVWNGKQKDTDLVIFSGGEDIHPSIYHDKVDGTYSTNPERDKIEFDLFKLIRQGKVKTQRVLGVCRGHQLLSAILGLQLIQDLGSQNLDHPAYHSLIWKYESLFDGFTTVNSMHHQAVSGQTYIPLSNRYTILANEPKTDVIEAILWDDFVLGVQFHPEFDGVRGKNFFDIISKWVNKGVSFTSKIKKDLKKPDEKLKLSYREYLRRMTSSDDTTSANLISAHWESTPRTWELEPTNVPTQDTDLFEDEEEDEEENNEEEFPDGPDTF